MQAFNDFIVEHKEQVETVEELEAKLKGLGDRFCNVTLPAILQLAKQQGESVDLNDTSILGDWFRCIDACMHDICKEIIYVTYCDVEVYPEKSAVQQKRKTIWSSKIYSVREWGK